MSNAVQHQTNRSPACTRTARSRRRMLYVVAVGTLISTLNQAYKSSEVHVSARMISGGRLLALTSSGIYRCTPLATLIRAMRRAGENRSLVRAILNARKRDVPIIGSDYANIFIRYITRPSWRKALSEITALTFDWLTRYIHPPRHLSGLIPFIRGIRERKREMNKRRKTKGNEIEEERREESGERTLSQTFRPTISPLFEESRARNSSPDLFTPLSRR